MAGPDVKNIESAARFDPGQGHARARPGHEEARCAIRLRPIDSPVAFVWFTL